MVIPLSFASCWQVAPECATAYRSNSPHGPLTTWPRAFMVAAAGGAVMVAWLWMIRDASDAITKARIVHAWELVLIPDELRMMPLILVR